MSEEIQKWYEEGSALGQGREADPRKTLADSSSLQTRMSRSAGVGNIVGSVVRCDAPVY